MNSLKFLFLFFFILQSAWSKNLSDYLQTGIQKSGLENSLNLRLKELQHQRETVGKWENPSIGIEYGKVKNTGITGSLVGATIEQNFPVNGRLGLESDKAKQDIQIAQLTGAWEIQSYKAQLGESLLYLWLEREKIDHGRHRIKDLGVLRRYLTNRKFSSPQQKSDAYLIKKKIEEIEFQLEENTFHVKKFEKALEAIVLDKIEEFELHLKSKEDLTRVFDEIIKNSPNIQKYRNSLKERSRISLKQNERVWIPDLSVGYAYQKENVPGGNLGHSVGLSFTIPIFDTGRSQTEQAKAQMKLQEARWLREDLKRSSQVSTLKERFQYYLRLIGVPLKVKEKDHQKELKKIKNFFLKGLINAQTYLDAEEISHDLHYRQVSAITEIVKVFIDASLENGKNIDLKEVLQ